MRQHVRRRVYGRVLLVGDASGYVDALTGEGIGVGLAQAEVLARCLAADRPADYERAWLPRLRPGVAVHRRPALVKEPAVPRPAHRPGGAAPPVALHRPRQPRRPGLGNQSIPPNGSVTLPPGPPTARPAIRSGRAALPATCTRRPQRPAAPPPAARPRFLLLSSSRTRDGVHLGSPPSHRARSCPFCRDCQGVPVDWPMIMVISQLISCRYSTKTEIPRDHAAPRARAPRASLRTTLSVTTHHLRRRHSRRPQCRKAK